MVFKRRTPRTWLQVIAEGFWPRGGWNRAVYYVVHRLRRLPDPPHRIARGIAAGVFVCFTPFFGFHFFLATLLAIIMQGNIFAALMATFVGNPLTFPFWIWIANRVGHKVLTIAPESSAAMLQNDSVLSISGLFEAAGATVLGFMIFAVVFPPIGYFLSKWMWRLAMGRRRKKRLSRGNLARQQALADLAGRDGAS